MHKKWKKFIDVNCNYCSSIIHKELKEYSRQKKNNPDCHFYCSNHCIRAFEKQKYPPVKLSCSECRTEFDVVYASRNDRKFCSKKCALTNRHRNQKINKKPKAVKPRPYRKLEDTDFHCVICNNVFRKKWARGMKLFQTCSKECYGELVSRNSKANPNCGGETNYRKYQYKNVTMDSSWEVELAQWMDENKITWIRSRKICLFWKDERGDLRRYYPDFYLPDYNIYLDPKNKYLQEKDKFKLESVQKEQNVKILSGYLDDIKKDLMVACDSSNSSAL